MSDSGIFDEFSKVAKTHSLKPAIFFYQDKQIKTLSYGELYARAIKLGNLLYSKGINRQDRIALLLGGDSSWPISFMALQYIGAVAVPLDCRLGAKDICPLLIHSQVSGVLCSQNIYLRAQDYLERLHRINNLEIFLIDSPEFLSQLDSSTSQCLIERRPLEKDIPVAIFYTSGTVTTPKAVKLSQKNLLSNVNSIRQLRLIKRSDVFISILPLHHAYSFMVACLLPLLHGASISYPSGFSSEELLNCIRNTRVSILAGVPQFFALIHRNIKDRLRKIPFATKPFFALLIQLLWIIRKYFGINLSKHILFTLHKPFGKNFRLMISGGAKIDDKIIRDFFKWGFYILEGYGLTEASPVVTLNTPKRLRVGSVGKPIPGVEVRIVSLDLSGSGEIAVRGPNLILDYLNLPQEAERVIKEGWFFTGDYGYLDRGGYLHIKGRKDELIVLGSGEKVNPKEIEQYYSRSPYIKEICVFASEKTGLLEGAKKLTAVVVPNDEYFKKRRVVNIEEKIRWELNNLSHHLRDFKRIKGFVIKREPLPRTIFGRIMRHEVNEDYNDYFGKLTTAGEKEEKLSQEDAHILSTEVYSNLFNYLSERLKRKINLDDHLELDLGLDSLNRVELLFELQRFFNIEVPDSLALELFYSNTIRDLVHKINPYLPEGAKLASKEEFNWREALNQRLSAEALMTIRLKPLFLDKVIAFIFLFFLRFLFRTFYLLTIKGKNNLPPEGPYIIYANHTSYLDGFLILSCLPLKIAINSYFVGFRQYFLNPLVRSAVKTARLIPIDPAINLVETLRVCSYLLKQSKIICLFPEGERSERGEVERFKKGIGILEKELNIPLIPIYIEGAFKAWSRYCRYPKLSKITITIGKKILYSELVSYSGIKDDDYEMVAENLRLELIKVKK